MKEVAVIVVTYNRLNLLKKCIEAVRIQTYSQFDIIVVNNGSTDGTLMWLETQKDIMVINQKNLGGAGGFHNGIKYAYNKKYKYFWIMDDDGVPSSECLSILKKYADIGFHYVAPNLKNFDGKSHFIQFDNTQFSNIVNHCGGPFNAILLSRKLVQHVGLPNKNFFIWGDEHEYVNRIVNAGFFVALCLNAIHFHKYTESKGIPTNRLLYKYRNLVWIYRLDPRKGKIDLFSICTYILLKAIIQMLKFHFIRFLKMIEAIVVGLRTDINLLRKGGEIE